MTRARVIWLLIAGYLSAVFLGFWGTLILLIIVWFAMRAWESYQARFEVTMPARVRAAEARAREAEERERVVKDAATEYADRMETTTFSMSGWHKRLREVLGK